MDAVNVPVTVPIFIPAALVWVGVALVVVLLAALLLRRRCHLHDDHVYYLKLSHQLYRTEENIMSSTQAQLDEVTRLIHENTDQAAKANAEVVKAIADLEDAINVGEPADFAAVHAALARQKEVTQSLDDIVADADPDASVDNSLPGDPGAPAQLPTDLPGQELPGGDDPAQLPAKKKRW